MIDRVLADMILVAHWLFVAFIVLGLVAVLVGGIRGWGWVRNVWFRWIHLLGIGLVVAQAWLGRLCPLTIWENALRRRAGDESYAGGFIAHWLHELLFFDAPGWVFVLVYSAFGAMVVAGWVWVRPRRR